MKKYKKIIFGLLTIVVGIIILYIPKNLIDMMNVESALVNRSSLNELHSNYIWFPITASILLSRCISYIVGIIFIYKGILFFLKD